MDREAHRARVRARIHQDADLNRPDPLGIDQPRYRGPIVNAIAALVFVALGIGALVLIVAITYRLATWIAG